MSESQNYEEVTVASDGITVIKTFEADAFPVPAIAFRIQSDRTEAVTVRLVDEVPENVAVEDLGFHPEYGSEFWTIEDDEITFEREIESEEQYTTVYGIRATGTDNVEQFLTEPDITDVDPPLEDEDAVVGSSSDVVRDVISGDTDAVPGLDDEDEDEDIGTLDLADPNAEGEEVTDDEGEADEESDAESADAEDEDEAEADAAEDADAESEPEADADETDAETDESEPATTANGQAEIEGVAAALATEIREGEVADEDLELLRDELDIETGGAEDARIQKLQTDVADLEAYIDALEEFLEENGTGQDIIEDAQEQLEEVQSRMDEVQSDIDDNNETVGSMEGTIDDLEADVQTLKGDIKDLDDDVEDIRGGLDDIQDDLGEVDDLEDRLEDIDQEISDLKEWREQLSNVLGAADD